MYVLRIHTCEIILLEKIYDKYKSLDHGFHREEEKWTRVREECTECFPSIDNSITWIILLFCLIKVLMDVEPQTVSKSEKEYIRSVYCHPAYLTCMQSTS